MRRREAGDRIVQIEPWLTRDKVMIDVLESQGIEKGKAFNPDEKTREILDAAAREAQSWLDARYEAGYPQFYEGRQLYDRATHALIRDVSRPSRSSQSPGLQTNADGSIDLYFGWLCWVRLFRTGAAQPAARVKSTRSGT
jgi:hypothetical protein